MAVILDEFPHMAGTAPSLAGTFRFGIGAIIGALLSMAMFTTAWPMLILLPSAQPALFSFRFTHPGGEKSHARSHFRGEIAPFSCMSTAMGFRVLPFVSFM